MNEPLGISLEYAAPAPDLRELISSYYLFDAPGPSLRETERADRAQLRFVLVGEGGYIFRDGHEQRAPSALILGPTTGPTISYAEGPLTIFGAGLQPAGWAAMMGAEAGEYTDRLLDAAEIFGSEALAALHARFLAARTLPAMAAIADEATRSLLHRADETSLWFTRMVDRWLAGPAPSVDALIAETGLSQRHVERLSKRHYGVGPKRLARKYRALRAASALARGDAEEIAAASDGFYDQSHLIREVKRFTGATPGDMRDHTPTLTRATIGGRSGLAGQVGPLVSDT
ncbi:MAG: helix-turn-helix transcriptional regulator [Sphingomonadaceae bacterium]|nr:helix-turn-helix transcriptional regulator [Sphingomonadaceae bacterium]